MPVTTGEGRSRLLFVLGVALLGVLASIASAFLRAGTPSVWVFTCGSAAALVGWAAWKRDAVLARLLLAGVVAAVFEIAFADRWAVESGSLVYAPGPTILVSPAYMPVSWMVATAEFALLGLWLTERFGRPVAVLLTGVIGGLNLPVYESCAFYAGWWEYRGSPAILHTPWYVILGELFIGAAFPLLAPRAAASTPFAIVAGAVLGAWMYGAARIAFALVG